MPINIIVKNFTKQKGNGEIVITIKFWYILIAVIMSEGIKLEVTVSGMIWLIEIACNNIAKVTYQIIFSYKT